MSLGRLLLALAVLAAAVWLLSQYLLRPSTPEGGTSAPLGRARTAARASDARNAQAEAATRELDSPDRGAAIHENMTPDEVRALLGPPDSQETETTESGVTRERWTYSVARKTVIFENGVAVRIE
jgi:hypothetical protein